ncbi:AmmeMemoRadiSam system radical SAM enzyme [Candidatus Sumerlaeota bacterium]|nr:AmmeMemoRadiSam system radical SAM enzyme [Candidatus Sumerlaeota bacterium]
MLYESEAEGWVRCDLCHHRCRIAPGQAGVCRARRNRDGKLESLVYARCIAHNADPIEKKPLFHFLPGTLSFSVATVGCNFRCTFCQNYLISQSLRADSDRIPGEIVEPATLVAEALARQCRSISFTYTEPTVFFEYALDTARLAAEKGLPSCFVSNGFMTRRAVDEISPYLKAINVDLKSFNEETYRREIGGTLSGVLSTIEHLYDKGVWVEVTTLLVPGLNDSREEIRSIARFVAGLSPDIPWHVSRFYPQFQMQDRGPTPTESIWEALEIGREEGLRYVYCGNARDERYESTWCGRCGAPLIDRSGYTILSNRLGPDGLCPECNTPCPGVWS